MKLGIMQPYFFPYIGYFQLISAVDIFVFYDDVNFIKQGWVNRNRILVNNSDYLFTIPIKGVSSYKKINETEIAEREYSKWVKKFIKSLKITYSKAPYFLTIIKIIENTLNQEINLLSDLAIFSIKNICDYLNISCTFQTSSKKFSETQYLAKADRLIKICNKLESSEYINPIGGKKLYTKEYFSMNGIKLNFLKTNDIIYKQFGNGFIPNLSIIDVLMFNSKERVKEFLNEYELI